MVVLIVVLGSWFGRAAWRAHKNIVSLRVRNAPVAEVIRQLERQTWEHIQMDKNLTGLVTLEVKNKPLATVLDRIAQQVGARWTTIYAVYDSKPALHKLELALRDNTKLEEAGWKTIAPIMMGFDPGNPGTGSFVTRNGGGGGGGRADLPPDVENMLKQAAADGKLGGGVETATEDTVINNSNTNGTGRSIAGRTRREQGSPIMHMVRRGSGGGPVEEEMWSPEEVILESRLSPRLGSDFNGEPTPEVAEKAAHQVKGRWKTYYALRKSAFGMDFAGMPPMRLNVNKGKPGMDVDVIKSGAGTNLSQTIGPAMPSSEELADAMRQRRLDELGKLTPEQRVQRAREHRNFTVKQ